ncbi:MAG: hypothetical protein R2790_02000 [Flavobacterium haoranii]
MKKIALIIALAFSFISNAQNWQGTFQTKFGTLKLVDENGIIYGDYANNGTILAYEVIDRYKTTLNGIYFNGNERGKFQLIRNSYSGNYEDKFIGYYGASDNSTSIADIKANSKNWTFTIEPNWQWTGTKQPSGQPNDLQTAVWNGKWNTTFGEINLEQIGTKIKGKYSNLGDIDADFDKVAKKLKGTFTNKGKKGYFEFNFEGNSFKGKWGWNTSMAEGIWDGTKVVKNNKELSKIVETNQSNNSLSKKISFKIQAKSIYLNEHGVNPSDVSLYGFVGFELYKVTSNSRVEVLSFGNKSKYLFNTNENQAFVKGSTYVFPNQPTYYREYEISEADWNDNNVQFELKVFHHIKAEKFGPNRDGKYFSEILDLKKIKLNTNLVAKREYVQEFGEYYGLLNYIITRQ